MRRVVRYPWRSSQTLKRGAQQRPRVRAHHLRGLPAGEPCLVGQPYQRLDAERGAYPVDQPPQVRPRHPPGQGGQSVLDPFDPSPSPRRQALASRGFAFERETQPGAVLGLVLEDPPRQALLPQERRPLVSGYTAG